MSFVIIFILSFSNRFCWLGKLVPEAFILNSNNHQPNIAPSTLSSSSCTQPGWRSCSRSSPTSLPRSSPRSLAMALLRWEVRKNKDSFFNIYFEHQGEDEADWAFEEEPAVEEVATNFLLERIFISPTRLPRSRMVRM